MADYSKITPDYIKSLSKEKDRYVTVPEKYKQLVASYKTKSKAELAGLVQKLHTKVFALGGSKRGASNALIMARNAAADAHEQKADAPQQLWTKEAVYRTKEWKDLAQKNQDASELRSLHQRNMESARNSRHKGFEEEAREKMQRAAQRVAEISKQQDELLRSRVGKPMAEAVGEKSQASATATETGPRGGRFYLSPSGEKVYVK